MILCYHGVSLADEHEWNPTLYISPRTLTRRLDALRRLGCTVLSLPEAVDRLYAESLPQRAVVLTFDDGYYDFKAKALPLLEERRYPATVYVTTDQWVGNIGSDAVNNVAVVNHLRTSYLSWRSVRGGLSPCSARALSAMTQLEVADVAARGVAIEMHTHRHRLPLDVDALLWDIRLNRDLIASTTGRVPRHLCYPDGVYHTSHLRHLRACGVETATTCDPGLATASYTCHRACGKSRRRAPSNSEIDGDVIGGVRNRNPAPFRARWAFSLVCTAVTNALHGRTSPRSVSVWARSGS